MDYPKGKPDLLDVISPTTDGWQLVDLEGNWFPDAFVSRMANMQRFVNGEDRVLEASVEAPLVPWPWSKRCTRPTPTAAFH